MTKARGSEVVSAYVALLRGINVGGKNKLAMADLRGILSEAGCERVRTYIQSGNAVFDAPAGVAERVAAVTTKGIAERFGLKVPVVIRSAGEMREIADGNPFLRAGADPATLYVAFLADRPDSKRVAGLDPRRSPGDSFVVRGREVYLCLPNGVADSKLTNSYLDSTLATTSTARNWRTVLKLVEMTSAAG